MKKPYSAPRCTVISVQQTPMMIQSLIQSQVIIDSDEDPAMTSFILWGGVSSFDTRPKDDEGKLWGD